jgi:hypothetical protein
MLTNKTLNANVDPSAIGGTYTWSAESCTCVTACTGCSCVSFTDSTGTVIGTDFSTVVTYPDDCTSIVIKLTIVTVEEEEQCVSTFYYNIVNELGGPQLTWACLANEGGCMQIPSENQIFETAYDCLNCATCPCSTSNVCQDATFQAEYDCITHELTITSANQIDWCTVPYPVIETVNIVLNFTQGNYTHAETINLPCNTALPLVIDLTADPLPEGFYYIHVIMQLDGCQVNIDSVEIDCSGGTGPFNVGCCAFNSGNDSYTLGQGQPPVVYTAGLTMPMVSDLIIDFHSLVEVDKLSVYSSWNNALQTGTEMATTGFVGLCGDCCNTTYQPFKQGYYEHEYLGALNTPTESPYQTCNGGVLSGTPTPVPGDFTFYAQSAGIARLILPAAYINTYAPSGTLFIVVFNNQGRTNSCPCGTIWKWRMFCGESCPCTEPSEPEIAITPAVCDISPGLITIVEACQDTNNNPVLMQWSLDGITWIDGEPLYAALPALNAVTQTLYTRCVYEYDEACASDPVETDYIKPECCVDDYNFTFECNPLTVGIYNQVDYQYRVIYEIPTCDDTANPAVVEQLYNTPVSGDFAYQVSFLGSSVILEVYFNSGSEYFFKVNCNLCWTAQYYIQINESQLANLLATHACEPCDITLAARYDYEATAYYISLDDVGGTNDFPSIPQGQPPYILTITKNGILTIAGIVLSYNGTILNTGPIYLTTTLMPNLSGEYTIVGYYPVVPGAPPVRNTNINYGFFLTLAYPGQYVINVTDHDGCIAETIVCNITAELSSCTANVLYARNTKCVVGDTFNSITVDGITYTPTGITIDADNSVTIAAILNYLNTSVVPTTGGSYSVVITEFVGFPLKRKMIIAYMNCDIMASLEFSTGATPDISLPYIPNVTTVYTVWTVSILPAFTITNYAWSLGDDLVLISGTLTDSTITTSGGGNLSVQVFTDECNPVTANACTPTVDIVSCAVEHTQVSIDHLPGANALNYYFKGLVANGINISSANIQLVGSDVTAAAVVEANILSFLNTNLRPSVGGVFDVNYTSTPSTSDLSVTWYKCEGTITDMQLRLNESDNTTPANSAVNTSTVFIPNTYILTLDYSPNVPITSYTWTLDGPTLGVGELTDSIIAVQGGGDVDIEIEVLDCGTATDSTCIASIVDIDTACGTVDSVTSTTTVAVPGDLFRGVEIGGIPYAGASIALNGVFIISNTSLEISITAWLDTNVVPTVGGYFTVVVDNSSSPMSVTVTWTGCDTLLDSLQLVMEDTLLAPYYGSLDNTPTTIPDLFLIEALVEPAGTLSNDDWYATGAMVVKYVVSETQAYVLYGGAGTLTYSVDVNGCGHANRTITV